MARLWSDGLRSRFQARLDSYSSLAKKGQMEYEKVQAKLEVWRWLPGDAFSDECTPSDVSMSQWDGW